jgi:cytochrome subunit of sulfide dehydrogenase
MPLINPFQRRSAQAIALAAACALPSLALAQAAGMAAPQKPEAAPAAVAVAAPPAPAEAQALYLRSLAATCANCHGTNGKAPDGSAVVSLAGQSKDYIVVQMAAFKSGARTATIMHQLAKGYTDAQINAIATYFAAQKK